MNLNEWAAKWGVSFEAMLDLRRELGVLSDYVPDAPASLKTEGEVQQLVRLEASQAGGRLWRNNVGVLPDKNGRPVRYGLCNESKEINKKLKSSDLIGIRPVIITPALVGRRLGLFTAREVKPEGWQYTGTDREPAQLAYLELVLSLGGDAAFVNGPGTL